jgi:hypothetical protein
MKKRLKIVTIRQAQNGNFLINGQSNNPVWVNGGEMRSLLIGYGLSGNSQAAALIGCIITYDEKVITQDDITNGTNKVKLAVPRTIRTGDRAGTVVGEITYTTVGAKQFNFGLELSEKLSDKIIENAVIKGDREQDMRAEQRMGSRALTADEDVVTDEEIVDDLTTDPETPEVTPENAEVVHEEVTL